MSCKKLTPAKMKRWRKLLEEIRVDHPKILSDEEVQKAHDDMQREIDRFLKMVKEARE